jgi:hypothetical protein
MEVLHNIILVDFYRDVAEKAGNTAALLLLSQYSTQLSTLQKIT